MELLSPPSGTFLRSSGIPVAPSNRAKDAFLEVKANHCILARVTPHREVEGEGGGAR